MAFQCSDLFSNADGWTTFAPGNPKLTVSADALPPSTLLTVATHVFFALEHFKVSTALDLMNQPSGRQHGVTVGQAVAASPPDC